MRMEANEDSARYSPHMWITGTGSTVFRTMSLATGSSTLSIGLSADLDERVVNTLCRATLRVLFMPGVACARGQLVIKEERI